MAKADLMEPINKATGACSGENSPALNRSGDDREPRVAPKLLNTGRAMTSQVQWYAPPSRPYTRRELLADRFVNFSGASLSWIAAPALCIAAWLAKDAPAKIAGFAAFGAGFVAMFTFSARYHYCCWDWTAKTLRPLDHIGINLMIMGSYTPPTQYVESYNVLLFVWVLGLAGVAYEVWRMSLGRQEAGTEDTRQWMDYLNIVRYLLMGWAVIMAVPTVVRLMPVYMWATMLVGGLLFTLGVPFFLWDSLEYHLAIWHVMVLLASTCFFIVQVELVGVEPLL